DPLPDEILQKYSLCGYRFAVENIHNPPDEASMDAARKRLIFEELMLFSLGLRLRRQAQLARPALPMQAPDMTPFYAAQPYELTGAQKRAVGDYLSDMTSGRAPMNRLLSGDVGSGKTVCAAAALYIAVQNGYQAALMAPTEILARQHFADLEPMFAGFGVSCRLLVGSTPAAEKRKIKAALSSGELSIVIGTHALLEDNVVFAHCGLVITDEQHRFGVGQRAALAKKAEHVNTLIMSATPIPRTLALMMFGDLDMSVLDEMPPGRQKVSTFAVDETYRARLNGFIRKQVEEGHQVYIVCPAVDENDEDDEAVYEEEGDKPTMKAAVAFANELKNTVFPDLSVDFLHGKMKAAEKDAVMARFVGRETMILVSTTVIEVGVNVPNATLMVVENAEHFGLSQLHQLRGRVGRGKDKAWCILVSDAKTKSAEERLSVMCKTNNGYEIAQKDLELRGPGDFFAGNDLSGGGLDCRQSGGLRFEIASFCDDMAMVEDAFAAAGMIAADDPGLLKPEHLLLRQAVDRAFGTVIL
ncbi:MAG: ATP-dependent DNA helicase RecG, partial [Clostridia bacterium]|nr:ATP-dependent DNA helicase RecG [Clostridia bacterium]